MRALDDEDRRLAGEDKRPTLAIEDHAHEQLDARDLYPPSQSQGQGQPQPTSRSEQAPYPPQVQQPQQHAYKSAQQPYPGAQQQAYAPHYQDHAREREMPSYGAPNGNAPMSQAPPYPYQHNGPAPGSMPLHGADMNAYPPTQASQGGPSMSSAQSSLNLPPMMQQQQQQGQMGHGMMPGQLPQGQGPGSLSRERSPLPPPISRDRSPQPPLQQQQQGTGQRSAQPPYGGPEYASDRDQDGFRERSPQPYGGAGSSSTANSNSYSTSHAGSGGSGGSGAT